MAAISSDEAPSVAAHLDTSRRSGRATGRSTSRRVDDSDDEDPLVDTTDLLPLHSKKLDRMNKKQAKRSEKLAAQQALASIMRLPPELLLQVLAVLRPTDVLRLRLVNRALHEFIQEHEQVIAKDIIERRYRVLSRCFPIPVLLAKVDPAAHPALLDPNRQKMLAIHKKPYQHVPVVNHLEFCTCMTCIYAWNNLCLILDFAHWQKNLNDRNPIPMMPRGEMPEWNKTLVELHARVVKKAVMSHLTYAAILEAHLDSTNGTLMRRSTTSDKRRYNLSETEAASGSDEYLERSGPASYEFPYNRDAYYSLEAYVPNRKWSLNEHKRWTYYVHWSNQHEVDVKWITTHFSG